MPVRLSLSEGTVTDCTQAHSLIADLAAQYLLADRGYDTNAIVAEAGARGMEPVIPPRSHRKEPRSCDRALYKLRHLETISKQLSCPPIPGWEHNPTPVFLVAAGIQSPLSQ